MKYKVIVFLILLLCALVLVVFFQNTNPLSNHYRKSLVDGVCESLYYEFAGSTIFVQSINIINEEGGIAVEGVHFFDGAKVFADGDFSQYLQDFEALRVSNDSKAWASVLDGNTSIHVLYIDLARLSSHRVDLLDGERSMWVRWSLNDFEICSDLEVLYLMKHSRSLDSILLKK